MRNSTPPGRRGLVKWSISFLFPFSVRRIYYGLLVLVLLNSLLIRLSGLDFDLPFHMHPDEPVLMIAAKTLLETGIQNVSYPPLYIRFLALQRIALGALLGPQPDETPFYLLARLSNALLSVFSILMVFLMGALTFSPLAGLIASSFLAINPTFVEYSRYATAEMPVTFLTLLSVYFSLLFIDQQKESYIFASLVLSLLAFITKYNAAPAMIIPFLLLLVKNSSQMRHLVTKLIIALFLVAGVFVTVYTQFGFIHNVWYIRHSERWFTFAAFRNNLAMIIDMLGGWNAAIIVLGLSATALRLKTPEARRIATKSGLMLGLVVAIYVCISWLTTVPQRHLVPLIPLLAVVWALSVESLVRLLVRRFPSLKSWEMGLVLLFVVPLLMRPAVHTVRETSILSRKHTLAITVDWFQKNVPAETRIAVEYNAADFTVDEYSGNPGPKTFQVYTVDSLLDFPIQAYRDHNVEYLVADSRAQEGYFSHPDKEEFLRNVLLIKDIPSDSRRGPHRAIFRSASIQHPMKVNLGNIVSFLGYDLDTTEGEPGETLNLTLYWQAMKPISKNYTVFTHLLDSQNQIRGQQDNWPVKGARPTISWDIDEVIVDGYKIPIAQNAAPGNHHVEVGMYLLETMERLLIIDENGNPQGNRILLPDIVVVLPSTRVTSLWESTRN